MKRVAVTSKQINFSVNADYTDWNLGNGGKNDFAYKLNVLHTILTGIKFRLSYWIEPCGGYGFSSGLVHILYPNTKMLLNDIDEDRYQELKRFKGLITNLDYTTLQYKNILNKYCRDNAVMFFDAYSFTTNNNELMRYTKKYICQYSKLIITDVFCYSMKPFNEQKYKEYLKQLQNTLEIENLTAFVYHSKKCAILTNLITHQKRYPFITEAPSIFKTFKL